MSNRFTQQDLNKLSARGMRVTIQPRKVNTPNSTGLKNKNPIPRPDCPQVIWMKWNLQYWSNEHALELCEQYRFYPGRLFRFDFALPAILIAIEYEGIASEKNGHTSYKGYTSNTEKYNIAATLGWKMLRYTAMNYKQVLQDLNKII